MDTVPQHRALGASAVVLVGGAVVFLLGLLGPETYELGLQVSHLLMVLFASGLTLTVAGVVDRGRRYLGAGLALLYVAASVLLVAHAPGWLGRGWAYGLLFMLWGGTAAARRLVSSTH